MLLPIGGPTLMLALAGPPLPASTEVIALVVLVYLPPVPPCTFTVMVQLEPDASIAPETVMVEEPATAVTLAPVQVLAGALGVETIMPPGRTSVKPIPVRAKLALLFVMVNVNEVAVFKGRNGAELAPKALVRTGACIGGMVPTMPLPNAGLMVRV